MFLSRFGPRSWPTSGRFAAAKESDFSNKEGDALLINQTSQSANLHLVGWPSCIRGNAPCPWAQELRRQTPNQTTDTRSTAPTANPARVRTIVSRCRGRLTVSAYPHLQNTAPSMGQRQCLVSAFTRGCRGPSLAPKMDIINYSCP